jgi:hypothetical protein
MDAETELWGTFSVNDHMRRRAFVAEVLLYDRLVIPVPPKEDQEHERWRENRWQPERQRRLVEILGDWVVEIPWDEQHRSDWETLYRSADPIERARARVDSAGKAAFDAQQTKIARDAAWPYKATRLLLTDAPERDDLYYEKVPGVEVEAVAAYPSFPSFAREVRAKPLAHGRTVAPGEQLLGVFGWEFFVPEDAKLSDEKLLEKAVKLAARPSFRDNRAEFHRWRRRMVDGRVDPDSAVAELEKRLVRYQKAARARRTKGRVKTTLTVFGLGAQAAALVFPPAAIPGAGLLVGAGALATDKLLPEQTPDERARVAAMCYDAREHFRRGWWRR